MVPVYEIRKSDLTVKRNSYALNFPEHMHKYIELVYVHKGAQRVRIAERDYIAKKGDVLVVLPDTLHSYASVDESDTEVCIIIALPKLFNMILPNLSNLSIVNPMITHDKVPKELKTAFEMISPTQSEETQYAWTCVVLSYAVDIIKSGFHRGTPIEDLTYKIIKYIEDNFTENVTRSSIARLFGVSEFYISKIFSENLKMDIRNYIGLVRVDYAAYLIRSTDNNFNIISQLSGFGTFRTFNRTFKQIMGMTPGEYRKNINSFTKNQ